MFVKKIMIVEARVEEKLHRNLGKESVVGALFQLVMQVGEKGVACADFLGRGFTLYEVGRIIVILTIRAPYQGVKKICSWAFTKSKEELRVVRHGQSWYAISTESQGETGSVRRQRQSASAVYEKKIQNLPLSSDDYKKVVARVVIVYYVAFCVTKLVYWGLFSSNK